MMGVTREEYALELKRLEAQCGFPFHALHALSNQEDRRIGQVQPVMANREERSSHELPMAGSDKNGDTKCL